MHGQQNIEKS